MQESKIVRTRNRFRDAENIFRKQIIFENFTSRQFSQFERGMMEIAANNEIIAPNIKRIIDRTDSTSVREKKNKKK